MIHLFTFNKAFKGRDHWNEVLKTCPKVWITIHVMDRKSSNGCYLRLGYSQRCLQ